MDGILPCLQEKRLIMIFDLPLKDKSCKYVND